MRPSCPRELSSVAAVPRRARGATESRYASVRRRTALPRSLLAACLLATIGGCSPRGPVPPETPADLPRSTHGREATEYRRLALGHDFDASYLLEARGDRQRLQQASAGQSAGVSPATWVDRGPSNAGGRTRAFLVHPNSPAIQWAGAASGGLWKSTDAGANWRPIDDFLPVLDVYSLAMDPTNPDVLYAGTGEVSPGVGILKSIDAGESWQVLESTRAGDFAFVRRIAIDPSDPQTMLAAVYHDFRGVQRSTDGGRTWQRTLDAAGASQVAFDPTDSSRALAAVLYFRPSQGYHWTTFYSVDGGRSWSESTGLPAVGAFERIELAYAPSSPNIVYAQVATHPAQVFRSTDGGRTFVHRADVEDIALDYMNTVWVSPTDPDFVIVAGAAAFRSLDGGLTFEGPINGGCMDSRLTAIGHVDIHSIVAHPGYNGGSNRRAWMTTDGGIFRALDIRTADCEQGWIGRNRDYRTTQFYSVAGAPSGMVVGGTQDQGSLRVLGSSDQAFKYASGDGGVVQIDPHDERLLYGSSQFLLLLFRSRDRGDTLEFIFDGIEDVNDPARVNFIAPILLDPHDSDTLYAGGISLWRAQNAASATSPTWRAVRPPGSEKIYHFSIAETDPNVLWLSQNDGKIYRTQNARATNPTWIPVEDNAARDQLPDRTPTRIQVSRHDPSTAYATFGGFHSDNLWRTRDQGASWQEISGPLPSTPKEAFVEHPLFPDWLYVGTSVGLFTSTDGGSTWSPQSGAPANVLVRDLQWVHDSTRLVMGTYGRGYHVAEVPGGDCDASSGALCVTDSRFDVRVSWRDFEGRRGVGNVRPLTADTGTFWFFDESNLELVVKVLDACAISDRFWVFAAGLTNVEVTLEITDTLTGATRRYTNPLGETFQPIQDTAAFAGCGARGASLRAEQRLLDLRRDGNPQLARAAKTELGATELAATVDRGSCEASPNALCLAGGRFRVEAMWDDGASQGDARVELLSGDTGYLWFFDADNVELLVKVLDACALSDTYWIFAGGLTNVGVQLLVTDTVTNRTQIYRSSLGEAFQPIQDTATFGCS